MATKFLNVVGQEQVGWAVWLTSSPKLKVYHGDKPEARHKLLPNVNEAAVGLVQWQHLRM